jgi:hypothetical protein
MSILRADHEVGWRSVQVRDGRFPPFFRRQIIGKDRWLAVIWPPLPLSGFIAVTRAQPRFVFLLLLLDPLLIRLPSGGLRRLRNKGWCSGRGGFDRQVAGLGQWGAGVCTIGVSGVYAC